jgi:hypothetical protein
MIGAVVLFASCKKESDIGLDIQPQNELIDLKVMDTLQLKTYTVREDSIRSDESPIIQLGSMDDNTPYGVGNTTAGVFTQFSIPNSLTNIDFSDGTLDSCVLQIRYDYDFYGDTADQQDFELYQMTEDIHKDSTYYSNHEKQYYSFPVGGGSVTPHPRKKTVVGADTLSPCLRLPVQYSFANQIFSQPSGGALQNNTAFQQYFKGFYVKPGPHGGPMGALLRFNLQDSLTKLTFYYHTATANRTFDFVVNSGTAYYSYFKHDYSTAINLSLINQLANPGTNSADYVFVQGASGLKTEIEFPTLASLQDTSFGHVIINKAELIVKADPTYASTLQPVNTQMYLVYLDSIGDSYILTDMVESAAYYGGSVNTTTNEYHINIARYFQRLVDGDLSNHGLYLKEYSPNEYGRRAVLGGANNNTTYKMYLHIVYTRIN